RMPFISAKRMTNDLPTANKLMCEEHLYNLRGDIAKENLASAISKRGKNENENQVVAQLEIFGRTDSQTITCLRRIDFLHRSSRLCRARCQAEHSLADCRRFWA